VELEIWGLWIWGTLLLVGIILLGDSGLASMKSKREQMA
jgi:hypothetical protein